MAMIKCPECGNIISDKAPTCIHCGVSLQTNKCVKIKIPPFFNGLFGAKACEVEIKTNSNLLWTGFSKQVASFEVDEVLDIVILIKKAYNGHLFKSYNDFYIKGKVMPGKSYEIRSIKDVFSLWGVNPTKSSWVLSEVDVIDSLDR